MEKNIRTVNNKFNNDSKTLINKNNITFWFKIVEDSDLNELLEMPLTPESLLFAVLSKVILYDVKSSINN